MKLKNTSVKYSWECTSAFAKYTQFHFSYCINDPSAWRKQKGFHVIWEIQLQNTVSKYNWEMNLKTTVVEYSWEWTSAFAKYTQLQLSYCINDPSAWRKQKWFDVSWEIQFQNTIEKWSWKIQLLNTVENEQVPSQNKLNPTLTTASPIHQLKKKIGAADTKRDVVQRGIDSKHQFKVWCTRLRSFDRAL